MRSPYALVLSFALGSAAIAQSPVPPGAPAPVEPIAAGQPAAAAEAEPPADPEAKRIAQRLLESTPAGRLLAADGIRVGGWTQMSHTASSTSRSNLPVTFNTDANAFQMNQNFLRVEKVIDPAKKEVQFGFRTETILPGTDARLTLARGLFDGQLRDGTGGGPRRYPIDLYQAYTEVFLPGIAEGTTVRVGKFATHCEYELVQGAETPFLSRSYLFQYNPFTHTGVWVTTHLFQHRGVIRNSLWG
jgi:hypothetical protein